MWWIGGGGRRLETESPWLWTVFPGMGLWVQIPVCALWNVNCYWTPAKKAQLSREPEDRAGVLPWGWWHMFHMLYSRVLRSITSEVTDLNNQIKLLGSLLATELHTCGHWLKTRWGVMTRWPPRHFPKNFIQESHDDPVPYPVNEAIFSYSKQWLNPQKWIASSSEQHLCFWMLLGSMRAHSWHHTSMLWKSLHTQMSVVSNGT